jgi:hypothetical protein
MRKLSEAVSKEVEITAITKMVLHFMKKRKDCWSSRAAQNHSI